MHTLEEMEKSQRYFDDLEETLLAAKIKHSGIKSPNTEHHSLSQSDDLPEHLDNLVYAARKLDTLPAWYWLTIDSLKGGEQLGEYIYLDMILHGRMNNRFPNHFTTLAEGYKKVLGRYSWVMSDRPDDYRSIAEEAYRILSTYISLHRHFRRTHLPLGVTDF